MNGRGWETYFGVMLDGFGYYWVDLKLPFREHDGGKGAGDASCSGDDRVVCCAGNCIRRVYREL